MPALSNVVELTGSVAQFACTGKEASSSAALRCDLAERLVTRLGRARQTKSGAGASTAVTTVSPTGPGPPSVLVPAGLGGLLLAP